MLICQGVVLRILAYHYEVDLGYRCGFGVSRFSNRWGFFTGVKKCAHET